jgi:hypothetical protein
VPLGSPDDDEKLRWGLARADEGVKFLGVDLRKSPVTPPRPPGEKE